MNFFPLSPQSPFPSGEGGVFGFSDARGFAPCIPEAEPERHWDRGSVSRADGGLAPALPDNPAIAVPDGGHGGFGRRLSLPHHRFFVPIPPTPFPRGEGGDFGFISPGATAPGTPAPEPGRRGGRGAILRRAGGLPRRRRITLPSLSPTGRGGFSRRIFLPPRCPAGTVCHGAGANARLHQQFIREKFLGVWGLLSRSPQRFFVSSL